MKNNTKTMHILGQLTQLVIDVKLAFINHCSFFVICTRFNAMVKFV